MSFSALPRPVVHYRFGCHDGRPAVLSSGPLLDSLEAHRMYPPLCHMSSNGIVGPLQTKDNVNELLGVASDSLAIEVWVTMIDDNAGTTPILAFAQDGFKTSPDCHGYQLALMQRGRWLELQYMEQEDCRITVLRQKELTRGRLQQVAVVWASKKTYIYVDGIPVVHGAPNQFDTTMSDWDNSLKLFLMGFQNEYGSSLSALSIYNQALSESDLSYLYRLGKIQIDQARLDRLPLTIETKAGPIHVSRQDKVTAVELAAVFDLSALNATAPDDWICVVEVSKLPRRGFLLQRDGLPVNLNDRLFHPTSLIYQPAPGYFTAPSTSYNGTNLLCDRETFSYRILAIGYDQAILATSTYIPQQLEILHVNHPPILKPPKKQILISTVASVGSATRPRMKIEGTQVIDDADKDIDRIRVDLWTRHGTLTLTNPENADFTACRLNERKNQVVNATWGCHGSGKLERSMTFVATPSIASRVLSDIIYQAFRFDQADEFVIRIYDGTGGACLSIQEHQKRFSVANEIHYYSGDAAPNDACFEVVLIVPVPPFSEERKNPEDDWGNMKMWLDKDRFGRADVVFWGFMGLCGLCFCMSIRRCVSFIGVRGNTIHASNFNAGVVEERNEQRNEVV